MQWLLLRIPNYSGATASDFHGFPFAERMRRYFPAQKKEPPPIQDGGRVLSSNYADPFERRIFTAAMCAASPEVTDIITR